MSGGIEQFSIGEEMDRLAPLMVEHGLKLEIERAPWNDGWVARMSRRKSPRWRVAAQHKELDFMLSHLRQAVEAALKAQREAEES